MSSTPKKVTIHDVAREAGCSIMTVSRALRSVEGEFTGGKAVRYRRVRQVAEQLGYKVNPHARALTSRKAHNIGFFVNHPHFSYYHPYNFGNLNSLQRRLEERGYQLGFYFFHSGIDPRLGRFLKPPRSCDALAFYGRNAGAEELALIRKSGICALSFLEEIEGVASITFDEWRGGRLAAEALHAAGHRRVGMLWRSTGSPRWDGRAAGFLSGVQELGMEVPEAANIELKRERGHAGDLELIASTSWLEPMAREGFELLRRRETGVTALYITSDFLAYPIVDYMDELGIALGRDLSVVSYDNFEGQGESPWGKPRLASVDIPREQMGFTAAEFLTGNLNIGKTPHLKLEPSFIPRSSLSRVSEMVSTRF